MSEFPGRSSRRWGTSLGVILAAWLAGLLTAGLMWGGWTIARTVVKPTSVWSGCQVDDEEVRVCVHRSMRLGDHPSSKPGTLEVYRYEDGSPGGRYLSYPWPFGTGSKEASVSVDGEHVTVTHGDVTARYNYASLVN